MYLLDLSGFHAFRGYSSCQAMGFSCQEQLGAGTGPHSARDAWMLCPLPCCAAHFCSHQLPAKGPSDAQSETRTAWNNLFLQNVHLCGQTCSAGIHTGYQWSQAHSSVPGFLTYALELSSFPVCPIYKDRSRQEGLGALRAS